MFLPGVKAKPSLTFEPLRLQYVRPSWPLPDDFCCVLMMFSVFLPAAHMKVPTGEHFTVFSLRLFSTECVHLCVTAESAVCIFVYQHVILLLKLCPQMSLRFCPPP